MVTKKPLEGVKVAELSTFVAAPSCARTLAEWGADVIKIESLKGDAGRILGRNYKTPAEADENPMFETNNANKRSICLNIKTEKGKEAIYKILAQADVFVTNVRSVSLKKEGLDYDTLKQKFPGLVCAQILGYGEKGQDSGKAGFDYTAYFARGAVMGPLMEKGTTPINPVVGFGDNQAGLFLTAGICAALYRKAQTGEGERVTVSLYHAGVYDSDLMVAATQYLSEEDKWPMTRKQPSSPLINSYKCKDGTWLEICIQEYDRYLAAFCKAIGREELAADAKFDNVLHASQHAEEMVAIIQQEIEKQDFDYWNAKFRAADLAFEKIQFWNDVLNDSLAWDNDILREVQYENGHKGVLVNTPIKFHEMGVPEMKAAPHLGADTKHVLQDLGYSDEEIATLYAEKSIG
ncbi:MAG: CaiB/BaiF CoA-transferase family protein [Sporolactobacillus sp.]